MTAFHRRDACPALLTPMPTGDGLLVRLALSGTIALDTFATLCTAAGRHGSGIVEVTARGSIQVRGLTTASAPAFAESVARLGLERTDGVPVLADPLAGLDPCATVDANALAAALRDVLAGSASAAMLGPKVSVVVDGGGVLHLDTVRADVRLRVGRDRRFHVALGGDAATAVPIGTVAHDQAANAATRLLAVIAAHGRRARAHDMIRLEGVGAFRAALGELVIDTPAPPVRVPGEPLATHRLRDGRVALGVALAFGHTDVNVLTEVVTAARRARAGGIRTAPRHALLIVGIEPAQAPSLAATVERAGLIVRADDPRRHIAACAGAPHCASAAIATRALGPDLASAAAPLLDGSLTIHLSGCAKGCAHPAAAALTIVGAHGGCGVVVHGAAGHAPLATVAGAALPASFARLAAEVARARNPGERAANSLSRVAAARIATILRDAGHG